MSKYLPSSDDSTMPVLDAATLQRLRARYSRRVEAPHSWTPRKPVESIISEASLLAALLSESGSPLLAEKQARRLREMALVARLLHLDARRLLESHQQRAEAEEVRAQAQAWMREMMSALRFLARRDPGGELSAQVAKVNARDRSDDGRAVEIHFLSELGANYEGPLKGLGLSRAFIERGLGLSGELREISARQIGIEGQRDDAVRKRNALLFSLNSILKEVRASLRYVYRKDAEMLKRISRK